MSDRPDEAVPAAGELEGLVSQVFKFLTEYAQGNLDSSLDLKTENPWGEQFNDQFQQLHLTLHQLLTEANEQARREQATRELIAGIQTATNLKDLLKVTVQGLADYLNAEVAFIELGMESRAAVDENGQGYTAHRPESRAAA